MRHEQRFAAIVTTDVDAKTHGFFWCGGSSWNARDYRCVILAVPSRGPKNRSAAIELVADTPEGLAQAMAEHALDPLPADDIRRYCESAEGSPKPPRRAPAAGEHKEEGGDAAAGTPSPEAPSDG